ncbi:MAG: DinB family protein [Candidatus Promineifilaceae bacterium]|nr:DinB family protein [Candidatus Promineifilaceae bacterium]
MTESRKKKIIQKLTDARHELLDVTERLGWDTWTHPVYAHGEEPSAEGGGEWSAGDLLRHLCWAESGMIRLINAIREAEEDDELAGVPEDFNLDRYNASGVRKLKDQMPAELLATMRENREQLLALIDDLEPHEWDKEGRHGSLRVLSVEEILHVIADHEAQHTEDLRDAFTLPME